MNSLRSATVIKRGESGGLSPDTWLTMFEVNMTGLPMIARLNNSTAFSRQNT
jgi:hypothetical protein